MNHKILVTGATGTVGQEVVKALLDKNQQIKVGGRDLSKLQNKSWSNQVEIVALDYDDPETFKDAFANVDKLFLVTPPGTYHEEEVSKTILEQGGKQELKSIVRLSGMGAENHNLFANHQAADNLLLASDMDYTALQPNTFMQNFYNYLTSIKEQQKISEPAAKGKTSFIDARDIAAVAAVALTEPGHANSIYELTGGEAFDYYQVAEKFSDILAGKITYQPLSGQEYIKVKEAEGIPAEFSEKFAQFFQMVQDGKYATVSPIVEEILGRPPITLTQFIEDYRDKFI